MKYGNFRYGKSSINFRYPIWWDKTITLFHRHEDTDTGTIIWYKKVLGDCFWKASNNVLLSLNTVASAKNITVRIPQNENYKLPYEWRALDDKKSYFTIETGDIIILGAINDTIDEYNPSMRSSDLLNKYSDNSIVVNNVNVNVHSGLGLPHYHIMGG